MVSRAEGSPKVKRNAFGTNFTTFVYNIVIIIRLEQELQKVINAPRSPSDGLLVLHNSDFVSLTTSFPSILCFILSIVRVASMDFEAFVT